MTSGQLRTLALSFANTEERPHFERTAFKVKGKRTFATLHVESASANLKLSPFDQSAFIEAGKGAVQAVDNKWGLQGWTTFDLKKTPKDLLHGALETAYEEATRKK